MSILDEINAAPSVSAMNAALRRGVETVSGNQEITFTKYTRKVLPLDGFVFWVRSSLLGDETPDVTVQGSLHLAMTKTQAETEVFSQVAVTFTSEQDVAQNFEVLNQFDILIGTAPAYAVGEQVVSSSDTSSDFSGDLGSGEKPVPVRFAFSRLGYYQNAGIFHYSGVAIFPHFASQIIDTEDALAALPDSTRIVSNSVPAFLSLNSYAPFYGFGNTIPLYPSMLAVANARPPFGVVHVAPESTEAIGAVPYLDQTCSPYQLARERVKVSFYGVGNSAVLTFRDCVLQYSQDYDVIGIMSVGAVRDEKSGQAELSMLASKKSVTFDVSYLQTDTRNIARQLILKATSEVKLVYPASWPVDPTSPPPP